MPRPASRCRLRWRLRLQCVLCTVQVISPGREILHNAGSRNAINARVALQVRSHSSGGVGAIAAMNDSDGKHRPCSLRERPRHPGHFGHCYSADTEGVPGSRPEPGRPGRRTARAIRSRGHLQRRRWTHHAFVPTWTTGLWKNRESSLTRVWNGASAQATLARCFR